MENLKGLNEVEIKVLISCVQEIVKCTRCEFGITGDIEVDGLKKNQIKGYLSQLVQKRYIDIFDNGSWAENQVMMTIEGCDFLLGTGIDGDLREEIECIKAEL